jgi:hypothetical protein
MAYILSMPSIESKLDRYVARVLESLEGPFEKLIFVTSLRDPYSGRYFHEGWANMFTKEIIHGSLVGMHQTLFEMVLDLSLPELCGSLRQHFALFKEEKEAKVAQFWLEASPFGQMIPEGTSPLIRRFFVSKVRTALEVLVHAPNWEYLERPFSSPPPPPDPQFRPQWTN